MWHPMDLQPAGRDFPATLTNPWHRAAALRSASVRQRLTLNCAAPIMGRRARGTSTAVQTAKATILDPPRDEART